MYVRWMRVTFSLLLVAIAIACGVRSTDAHHAVLRFNLEEMTVTADRVFMGQCMAVEETREMVAGGMLPVTRYTFQVERALKGRLPKQITFRQLGHRARRSLGKGGEITMHGRTATSDTFFHGMSEYNTGDRLVLFLIPNYLGGKVTYPVGLDQGAFFVSEMPSGQALVRNGLNNLGLFTAAYNGTKMKESDAKVVFPDRDELLIQDPGFTAQSASLVRKRGSLPLEGFLGLVEQIVVAHGGAKGVVVE